jgi:hypothetical protein
MLGHIPQKCDNDLRTWNETIVVYSNVQYLHRLEDSAENNDKNSQVMLSRFKLSAPWKKVYTRKLHNISRFSDILWLDLENVAVVVSTTEAKLTGLFSGLLKQHKRLTINNYVRKSHFVTPLDSSEKRTKFITNYAYLLSSEAVLGHLDLWQPEHWNRVLEFHSKNKGTVQVYLNCALLS